MLERHSLRTYVMMLSRNISQNVFMWIRKNYIRENIKISGDFLAHTRIQLP